MKKIKLVRIGDNLTFPETTPWGGYYFAEVTPYHPNGLYDLNTTFIVNDFAVQKNRTLLHRLLARGYKVVFDSVWECLSAHSHKLMKQFPNNTILFYCGTKNYYSDINVALVPNFFWIREYMYNTHYGLDLFRPKSKPTHTFLCPMSKGKFHRDAVYDKLGNQLQNALYSYVAKGKELPFGSGGYLHKDGSFDRHFDSDWYDSTYFTLVVETEVSGTYSEIKRGGLAEGLPEFNGVYVSSDNISLFLTEKTFKPIAFYHPFLLFAQYKAIARLKNLGFETYDHIFKGHPYDTIESGNARLISIRDVIEQFNTGHYHNPLTQEMAIHNRELFYNKIRVEAMLYEELIQPLEAFAFGD